MHEFAQSLGLRFPLIQAGMGGIAGASLAAAVSRAGAGGVLALYRMREQQIRHALQRTRALTDGPFGVNLIPELMDRHALEEQIEATIAFTDARVFFTFYGIPPEEICERLLRARKALLVMVGSAGDAERARDQGATAVILQGTEAGGHLLGTQRLHELIADVKSRGCRVPFLGAGGIASGVDFRRIQAMGACGCVCGTMFVATTESEAHPLYKQRVIESHAVDTVVTDIFDIGWPRRRHRVLRNALTAEKERRPRRFIGEMVVLGMQYPIARYSAMVPTTNTRGAVEEMAMYCGESVSGVNQVVAASRRVRSFIAEFESSFV